MYLRLDATNDPVTGDLELDEDLEVNGVITENSANVYTVLQATRNIYVATTGSDTNDGRTALTPFLTIQKAVDEAGFQASNTQTIVNVAAGTYTEAIVVPKYAVGEILVLGDRTTPSNVVIDDTDVLNLNSAFTHEDNNALLVLEGLQFDTFFQVAQGQNTRMEIGGIDCVDCFRGFRGLRNAQVEFFDNGSFNTAFAGTSAFTTTQFLLTQRFGQVTISDDLTLTNIGYGFSLDRGSFLGLSSGFTISITFNSSTNPPNAFACNNDSEISFQGDVTIDGDNVTPKTNGSVFSFTNGWLNDTFFLGGITFTIDDMDLVFSVGNNGKVFYSDDSSVTFTRTNVLRTYKSKIGSVGFDDTGLIGQGDGEWEFDGYDSAVELMRHVAYFSM